MTTNDISPFTSDQVTELTQQVTGVVLLPGQDGYEQECSAYNFAVANRPAVVVGAAGPGDVQAALAFAEAHGLGPAVMNTGHTSVVAHDSTLLITTRRMDDVSIDARARTARVGAGVRWDAVVQAAAEHGLAPLNGSSPLVGVVGYSLGGGLSPTLGRRYGWASDHVVALDLVTADGRLRHVDADTEPELFWAVRGAKSNLGVVTALEFGLFPVTRLYGGALIFSGEHAEAVLRAYAELTGRAPNDLTSSIAFMRFPDLPVFPEPLRGAFNVHVRISWLGAADEADALLSGLRAVGPIIDTVADMPYTDFAGIHSDPVDPAPFAERTLSLPPLNSDLVDELLAGIGPGADVPATIVELRHLGGALHDHPANAGAAGLRDAEFVLWVLTVGDPGMTAPANQWAEGLFSSLKPWALEGKHLNFMAQDDLDADAVRAAYPPATFRRLEQAKAVYDPANRFRLNHNIVPAR